MEKEQKKCWQRRIEKEISQNYKAFLEMTFSQDQRGKFALLKDGNLIEIMNNKTDAHKMGTRLFDDGLYSIQEIFPKKSDLGFMSYALR